MFWGLTWRFLGFGVIVSGVNCFSCGIEIFHRSGLMLVSDLVMSQRSSSSVSPVVWPKLLQESSSRVLGLGSG